MNRENTDIKKKVARSMKPTVKEFAAMTLAGYIILLPALLCTIAAIFAVLFFIRVYLM